MYINQMKRSFKKRRKKTKEKLILAVGFESALPIYQQQLFDFSSSVGITSDTAQHDETVSAKIQTRVKTSVQRNVTICVGSRWQLRILGQFSGNRLKYFTYVVVGFRLRKQGNLNVVSQFTKFVAGNELCKDDVPMSPERKCCFHLRTHEPPANRIPQQKKQ